MSNDFIEVYDIYSPEYCQMAIDTFEIRSKYGVTKHGFKYGHTRNRLEEGADPLKKSDTASFFPPDPHEEIPIQTTYPELLDGFLQPFWDIIYEDYATKYSALRSHEAHGIYSLKVQKTRPGEGYHVWHCENQARMLKDRLLSFILYLNDDYEAGETEFLYQQRRIQPKTGTCVLFPGAFTHTHRGNPPIGADKYIITGWVEM